MLSGISAWSNATSVVLSTSREVACTKRRYAARRTHPRSIARGNIGGCGSARTRNCVTCGREEVDYTIPHPARSRKPLKQQHHKTHILCKAGNKHQPMMGPPWAKIRNHCRSFSSAPAHFLEQHPALVKHAIVQFQWSFSEVSVKLHRKQ